ncbi:MAG TPA: hypothetical protein VM869_19750 [Enhygromyxa sp.]|nr:hypothetical protein [Enhygromyxa sp.]
MMISSPKHWLRSLFDPIPIHAAFGVLLALGCADKQAVTEEEGNEATGDETSDSSNNGEAEAPSEGDGDGDDDGQEFVQLPDGGAVNTCDPAGQDCPEGEKCTGYVVESGSCCVDANKCVSVIGNGQLGDPCMRSADNDDCDVGLFCMTKTSGSTGDGVCLAFCDVGLQDCGEDGLPDADCIAFNDGTLPLCQDSCDPLTQDCGTTMGCYGVGEQGFVCSMPGYEDGLGNDGDMCYTVQSCKPGLGCTATDVLDGCNAARCCTPYCDLSEPDPCTAPEQCVPYFEEGTAPPNYETVGLCAIPA